MKKVGIVAHAKKQLGGGLPELRQALGEAGLAREPLWYPVEKSRRACRSAERCVDKGVDLLIAWGGDGTVQRCVDALVRCGAGREVPLAIVPAGTANLLATNLGVPRDVRGAVDVALRGRRRALDVGRLAGEHFAVMAGMGFDALMIRDADGGLKDRLGRAAYLWTGLRNLRSRAVEARVTVDGEPWFAGPLSCLLLGNVGCALAGIHPFPEADPGDGRLEVGVVKADSWWEWVTVLARAAAGAPDSSPLVLTTRAEAVEVELDGKLPYQLDGGERGERRRLRARALAQAISLCVSPDAREPSECAAEHGAAAQPG